MLFHAEVVRRNGKPVGYVRAGSYGHTLGGAVGLVMIEAGEPVNAGYLERGALGDRHRRQDLSGGGLAEAALRSRDETHQIVAVRSTPGGALAERGGLAPFWGT